MNIKEILEKNSFCESEKLEVKVDLTREVKKKFLKSIVSFLNSNGGYYILGISDNFDIIGIPNSQVDEYTSWLSNKLSTGIFNFMQEEVSIKTEEIEEKLLIIVTISAGRQQIYYDLSKGIYSGTYIRVGTTTQVMDRMRIDSIQQKFVQTDLSQIKAQNQLYKIEQLKFELESKGVSISEIALNNFGLLMEGNKKTKLYELLADENTTVINFASFNGIDRSELIERENFGEVPLFVTTRRLLEKINLYNKTTSIITGIERIDSRLVDPIAIRELTINAIVHNDYSISYPNIYWYSNRVEITSNGGLPIGMTFDEFYAGQSRPRNPKLAFLFTKLGLVEQLGSGVERVLKYYDKSIFDITDSYFKVTLMFNEHTKSHITNYINESNTLTKKDRSKLAIVQFILENNGVTIAEICNKVDMAESTVYKYVKELQSEGQISKKRVEDKIMIFSK